MRKIFQSFGYALVSGYGSLAFSQSCLQFHGQGGTATLLRVSIRTAFARNSRPSSHPRDELQEKKDFRKFIHQYHCQHLSLFNSRGIFQKNKVNVDLYPSGFPLWGKVNVEQ